MPAKQEPGGVGDWIVVDDPGGGPARRGEIREVLGGPGHEHYRVRWMDDRESIYYPAEGAHVRHRDAVGAHGAGAQTS